MRASPPGIASRGEWVESSPVGGTPVRPRRNRRRLGLRTAISSDGRFVGLLRRLAIARSPLPSAGAPARRSRRWIAAALAVLGLALTGHALYIHAKALLAQALLHRAWVATQATGTPAKPWPWADTAPVARLIAPEHEVDLLVLAGATGRTLAFGPGHHDGSALPGEPGNVIFSAHRDTHFRFLRAVAAGDALIVETPAGRRIRYRVRETEIVDVRDLRLPRLPSEATLTLVTCWPFEAVEPGGPMRFVVVATADGGAT